MQRSERWVALGLAILGLAVLWSARAFPDVPGQRVGAAFLPMLTGAGLVLCAAALAWRGYRRSSAGEPPPQAPVVRQEHFGSSLLIIGAVIGYIVLADRLGFLIVAPLCLVVTFLALRVKWPQAVLWALLGSLVVHVAFYKLLRVPLPWGVLRPFY